MRGATTTQDGVSRPRAGQRLRPTAASVVLRAYGTMIRAKLMLIQGAWRRLSHSHGTDREALEQRIASLERELDRVVETRDRVTMATPELPEHRVMTSRRLQERIERALADIHRALPTMTEHERAEILARDLPLLIQDRNAFASMFEASLRDTLTVFKTEEAQHSRRLEMQPVVGGRFRRRAAARPARTPSTR
jgi:hypothetical protein